ncbi:Nucleoporin NUP84 [Paramyrothecium foliicola]|nr:Nucleoporin NUP84 [Paramyrothecium foliicola]
MELTKKDSLDVNDDPTENASPEVDPFARALDDCLSSRVAQSEQRSRILNLPQRYHDIVLRRLAELQPARRRVAQDDVDMDVDDAEATTSPTVDDEEIQRLEREVQTWDLLRRILPLRYSHAKTNTTTPRTFGVAKPALKSLMDEFLENNPVAQERLAVLQWLQKNAAAGPDIDELVRELQQNADRGDIIAHGWLHTRSSIKLRKSLTQWPHLLDRQSSSIGTSLQNSAGAPLVTQLDPDAVTRQGRKLEPQDEYFERAVWLGCFEHIRRGSSLETIRDWCQERTEMWRAISMSAMLLSADDKSAVGDSDPASLALWRRMCFGVARQGGTDDYERAVYGVLCGDITSVEKVAETWDDFLFANYNALLRTQLDTFVLGRCPPGVASNLTQTFSSFDAVQYHGEQDGVERRLIRSLESRKSTHNEALEPGKALQAAFIAKDIGHHLYEQGLALTLDTPSGRSTATSSLFQPRDVHSKKYFSESQRDGLRIVAHVYSLIALLERLDRQEGNSSIQQTSQEWRYAQGSIIASYTDYLRDAKLPELIPLYCSILEAPRSYEVLSKSTILVTESPKRLTQLHLIKQAGIEVVTFVKTQASILYDAASVHQQTFAVKDTFKIIEDGAPTARHGRLIKTDFISEDENAVDKKHENLVRSVEWLLMVTETWPDVFSMGTKVYKFFLKHMHLNAARKLMKNVSFAGIVQDMTGQDEYEEGWYDDVGFWTQQLEQSGLQGVDPQTVLKDARTFRELEALVKALDSLETVASMVEISIDMPASNRVFWDELGRNIVATKENMQPLLRNWLLPDIQEGDKELAELRRVFLPETVLAYVSALHFAGTALSRDNLLECMELAAVVAERNSDLAASFVEAGRMRELVEVFAAASRALAVATGDKRSTGSGSKKLREMGWSRDLWSIKS